MSRVGMVTVVAVAAITALAACSSSPSPTPTRTTSSAPPTAAAPSVQPEPRNAPQCDPNYSGACVPIVSYDLDCADIGSSVSVIGSDPHGFDADFDGYGCESY